jgi:hypothetical protein
LGPISWTFEKLSTRARVGKKKNTIEGSGGITFSNPAVVGVEDRVKTLAAQGSDGSFSGVREHDILTVALETPEHQRRVRGVSSSLGWGKGLVKSSLECTGTRGTRGLMLMM